MGSAIFSCKPLTVVVRHGAPAWHRFSEAAEWGWSATYNPSLAPRAFGFRFSFEFRFKFWFTVVRVGEPKIWRQGQNGAKLGREPRPPRSCSPPKP